MIKMEGSYEVIRENGKFVKFVSAIRFIFNSHSETRILRKKLDLYDQENYAKRVIWRWRRIFGHFKKLEINDIDYVSCEVCYEGPLIPVRYNSSGVDVVCLNCGSEDEWTW